MESFPLSGSSLDAGDVEILYIVAAAFMPGVLGLLLALFAHWLPDDGYVLSQQPDNREGRHGHESQRDWPRAA